MKEKGNGFMPGNGNENEVSIIDLLKDFNEGFDPDEDQAELDFPSVEHDSSDPDFLTVILPADMSLQSKIRLLQNEVLNAYCREHIDPNKLYHSDDASRHDLSTPVTAGGAVPGPTAKRLYLGDFRDQCKTHEHPLGIADSGTMLSYDPLSDGNLMIISQNRDQIRHTIETLITDIHCTDTAYMPSLYISDLSGQYGRFKDTPLIGSYSSDIYGTYDMLDDVRHLIAGRTMRYDERRSYLNRRILVFITSLPSPDAAVGKDVLALINDLVIRSDKFGVYFVIAASPDENGIQIASLRNSMGRIMRFRSQVTSGNIISLASPDPFDYTGTGYKHYGHALQVSSADIDLVSALKPEDQILREYDDLIRAGVYATDKIIGRSFEGYDIDLKAVIREPAQTPRKITETLDLLEKIRFIRRDEGKIIPLISKEFWENNVM